MSRVVVAMSGGVDSSVAALILKEQGYEVIGISLKVWDETSSIKRTKTCCSLEDINDARAVCSRLGIPFYAFNYKKEFEQKVINRFVSEYQKGRTPNPCILCNQHIKFDQLLQEAKKLGAQHLATGHHARIQKDADGVYHILKGKDLAKDQSYVLYQLGQEQLKHVLLPIGEITKEEVRQKALSINLPTATKPESQDICFIPNRDHASFIQTYYPQSAGEPGNFVDKNGNILGRHRGIHVYTVGQRRGLGIGFEERLYVTRIDAEKNEVELGVKEDLATHGIKTTEVVWTNPHLKGRVECGVKVRYQKDEIPCWVERDEEGKQAKVYFKKPYQAISPGQAAVFYQGDKVLGGGWIEEGI